MTIHERIWRLQIRRYNRGLGAYCAAGLTRMLLRASDRLNGNPAIPAEHNDLEQGTVPFGRLPRGPLGLVRRYGVWWVLSARA